MALKHILSHLATVVPMITEYETEEIDMKAERFNLANGQIRKNVVGYIMDLPCDGTIEIVIQSAKAKSARQRGLQHIWYGDVVKSGIGGEHESDKDLLDLACKYRWALPIMIRDDDNFAEVYLGYAKKYKENREKMLWFVKQFVHTEYLDNSQMAEFLTSFRDYYAIDLGVNLTDPADRGWESLLEYAA